MTRKNSVDKTLRTLKRQDPYPLYTAQFYHNYRFQELTEGSIESPEEAFLFFRNLYKEWGRTPSFRTGHHEVREACSAFVYRTASTDQLMLARNLDWEKHPVLLYRTDPDNGYASLAVSDIDAMNIFDFPDLEDIMLMAPFFPFEGINSEGLTIVMLSVPKADAPFSEEKPTISNFNLIRGLLDYCADIDEAVNYVQSHNIIHGYLPIHYLLADARGNSCALEHVDGKLEIIRKEEDPLALTNFPLASTPLPEQKCDRYKTLMKNLRNSKEHLDEKKSWDLLRDVSMQESETSSVKTVWSSQYNPSKKEIQLSLQKKGNRIYRVSLQNS